MRSRNEGSSTIANGQSLYRSSPADCPLTRSPHQERLPILSLLQIGHDAVHNMRLRREDIDDVDIALTGPAVLNLFNVWNQSGCCALA
jgi:hypothetical protein